MRVLATNHVGWVIEEFKKSDITNQLEWIAITMPDKWNITMDFLDYYNEAYPNQQFRIYEALS